MVKSHRFRKRKNVFTIQTIITPKQIYLVTRLCRLSSGKMDGNRKPVYTLLRSFCYIIVAQANTHVQKRVTRRFGGLNTASAMYPMFCSRLKIVDLLNTVPCLILLKL